MCVFRLEQVIVHVGCMSIKDSQELVSTMFHNPFYSHLSCIYHFFMHSSLFIAAVLHTYFSPIRCLSIRVTACADKQLVPSS